MRMRVMWLLGTLIIALSIPALARAADTMIFWYPGEAGSTDEAQPILDEFFSYLKERDPSLNLHGAYFNSIEEGRSYLRSKKPALGILSFPVWTMEQDWLANAAVIMSTLPRPHGAPTEQYVLVGANPLSNTATPLFTSEPLSRSFIAQHLFAELPAKLEITQTASMLMKLKAMAEGTLDGYAILTPMESYSLSRLGAAWTKKLSTLATSRPVPTARVVLFAPSYAQRDALIRVLTGMGADHEARAILEELRLSGFSTN